MKTNSKQIGLEIIAGIGPSCKDGICPTVYKSNDGRFFVQGTIVADEVSQAAKVPKGECIVEVPQVLLQNLITRGIP